MDARVQIPGNGLIGIVTGGVSRERPQSFKSGEAVAESLARQGYHFRVFDSAEIRTPDSIENIDFAFLAIAGQYAEDGKLQGFFETLRIPYTGSGVLASALGMNKVYAKIVASAAAVPVFPSIMVTATEHSDAIAEDILSKCELPIIFKPVSEGSSIGITIAHSRAEMRKIVDELKDTNMSAFAEPFAEGRSFTVGVIEIDGIARGLPPLEIVTSRPFFDIPAKQDRSLREFLCPAPLPGPTLDELSRLAEVAHNALGCRGYSRSDFVISTDGSITWLEINTLPSLMTTATLATMAAADNISYDELISYILKAAITQRGYQS